MTIKDAILISLKDFPDGAKSRDIYQNIVDKKIFEFNQNAKTPDMTVQALLGDFIRDNDPRVCRTLNEKRSIYIASQNTARLPMIKPLRKNQQRQLIMKEICILYSPRILNCVRGLCQRPYSMNIQIRMKNTKNGFTPIS